MTAPPNQTTINKIPLGLRLGTMFLDHVFVCLITIPPLILIKYLTDTKHSFTSFSEYQMIMPLFVIYFCKDCIGGRSLAKRILKLVVLDNKKGTSATSIQTVIRNLFVIAWPVEVLVSFFDQQRRIGDRLAGTKLSYYEPQAGVQKTSIPQIVASILIAATAAFLLFKFVL